MNQGSHIMRFTGQNHSDHAKLIHFTMFRSPASGIASYAHWLQHLPISQKTADSWADWIEEWGLPEDQVKAVRRRRQFSDDGRGYLVLQTTRVGASPFLHLPFADK